MRQEKLSSLLVPYPEAHKQTQKTRLTHTQRDGVLCSFSGTKHPASRMESIKMWKCITKCQSIHELSEVDGLLIRGSRVVVPLSQRAHILQKIHDGHQGLTKHRDRAQSSVWWPGLSAELKSTVMSCRSCQEQKWAHQKEPLIYTPLPDHPWKRIALDLCEHNKNYYLVILLTVPRGAAPTIQVIQSK